MDRKLTIILLTVLAVAGIILYGGYWHREAVQLKDRVSRSDTVTITQVWVDTLRDTVPKIVSEVVTGETVRIPVPVHDTTEVCRVDTIDIPVTQREYTDDSTYTAWVSGVNPRLDSIEVYRKTIHDVVTVTIPAERKRTLWQHIVAGVQAGYGLGLDDKQGHPYVGLGISINF